MSEKNRKVSYSWVQYATGRLKGLFTVRRIVEEDFASVLTQSDAMALIKTLEQEGEQQLTKGPAND